MTRKEAEDALKDILSTVIYHFADENDIMRKKAWSAVTNLEEAVKAEGVAEGARVGVIRERRRLKAARDTKVELTRSINEVRHYLIPVREFSVPIASVLAPTKEGEK